MTSVTESFRDFTPCVLGALLTLTTACGDNTVELSFGDDSTREELSSPGTVPPLTRADGEDRSRYIGVLPSGRDDYQCPYPYPFGEKTSLWTVDYLFRIAGQPASAIPPSLRPFCLYLRESESVTDGLPTELEALVDFGELAAIGPDHWVVSPSAGPLEAVLAPEFAAATEEHMGKLAAVRHAGATPVRIAVVDSTPTAPARAHPESHRGRSDHGFAMLNLIRNLVCGPAGCAAELTSRLALPLHVVGQRVVKDSIRGGHFGYIGGLAQAVHDELVDWRSLHSSKNARLVLNVAVAWPRVYGGDRAVGTFPPDVLAVYRALEYAHCEGAAVIAAAGNQTGGPSDTDQPLYPGGWETHPAPTSTRCGTVLGNPPPVPLRVVADHYTPFLYAAGGIDALGSPLAVSRPGGQPRIVAYADHAVAQAPGGRLTSAKTGTSSSTAAVSAIVAMVWSYEPRSTLHTVMDIVHRSGQAIGADAEFCLNPPCSSSHRVTVCEAVTEACLAPSQASHCPVGGFPACHPWVASRIRILESTFESFDDASDEHVYSAPLAASSFPECRSEGISSEQAIPCPRWQFHGSNTVPYMGPQPPDSGCPNCPLTLASDTARLNLSTDIAAYDSPTVTLIYANGDVDNYGLDSLNASGTDLTVKFSSGTLTGVESGLFSGVRDGVTINAPLMVIE